MTKRSALQPTGFFVLRTPLLSFDEFLSWTSSPKPASKLREFFRRPEVLDALYVASPSLADTLSDADSPRGQRALPGLASYFARMCSRVTPFGLFAGVSAGHLGSTTCLDVGDLSEHQRHSRLDMGYLSMLVAALEQDPEVRRLVTWAPNTSLYRTGGRLHFAAVQLSESGRAYNLVEVDQTKALNATLDRARHGATVSALSAVLEGGGVSAHVAEAFVFELIDAQLLVSDLELHVTGEEPIDALISALSKHAHTEGVARSLDEVRTALQAIDHRGPGATPSDYRRVQASLDSLPVQADAARLFKVDLSKPSPTPTLGPGPIAEIGRAVEILHRLASGARPADPLNRFCDAFVERYEDREVPLVDALDPEIGIGFDADVSHDRSPLLEGLEVSPHSSDDGEFSARDALLLRKLAGAIAAGHTEISLDEADLDALAPPEPALPPDSLQVVAVLAARSPEAIDQGDYQVFIRGILGPPGVGMLGRFCYADQHLDHHVRQHLKAEEAHRPDAVFAEVVHLPEGRVGNILCRPVLRQFEIPYLGRSGAAADSTLPVADLLVSVTEGRVRVRSRRLEREIIPRLTTAHDFTSRSLGLYHFLCSLQDQGSASRIGWDWGPLHSAPFLPRVTCGRLVLARAQWRLEALEFAEVAEWRASGRLPRFVTLADGDNDLATDLDNPLSVEALRRHAAGSASVSLVEMFPGPDEMCSVGPSGRFAHDIVVPFVRRQPSTPTELASAPAHRSAVRRSFAPGSEWFYAKLYTGKATADRVLVDLVRPIVDEAVRAGVADSWFFIRYADPHWHLRVRLHGDAAATLRLLHELSAPLLADGRLWRVQLDTYEREIERYGGDDGIALAEQVFHHDSEAVLELVQTFKGDVGQDARWRLAMLGVDMLLADLGLDLNEKVQWAKRQRHAYAEEFRATGRLKGQLGDLYRKQRQSLGDLFERGHEPDQPFVQGIDVLRRRSERLRLLKEQIDQRNLDAFDMASSYAHMHVNRMLRSAHRAQELVMYDLLHRHYVSRIAISHRD